MADRLIFDTEKYEIRTCELNGRTITFRAFEGLDYCGNPADPRRSISMLLRHILTARRSMVTH